MELGFDIRVARLLPDGRECQIQATGPCAFLRDGRKQAILAPNDADAPWAFRRDLGGLPGPGIDQALSAHQMELTEP